MISAFKIFSPMDMVNRVSKKKLVFNLSIALSQNIHIGNTNTTEKKIGTFSAFSLEFNIDNPKNITISTQKLF